MKLNQQSKLMVGSFRIVVMLAVAFLFSSCASTRVGDEASKVAIAKMKTDTSIKPYPFDTCFVMGRKLDETPKTYTRIYNGQEIKFCCIECVTAFDHNPKPFMGRLR